MACRHYESVWGHQAAQSKAGLRHDACVMLDARLFREAADQIEAGYQAIIAQAFRQNRSLAEIVQERDTEHSR